MSCAVIAQSARQSRTTCIPALPPMNQPFPIDPDDFIAGLAKGLAVLESFDTERQRLNATMAAALASRARPRAAIC